MEPEDSSTVEPAVRRWEILCFFSFIFPLYFLPFSRKRKKVLNIQQNKIKMKIRKDDQYNSPTQFDFSFHSLQIYVNT